MACFCASIEATAHFPRRVPRLAPVPWYGWKHEKSTHQSRAPSLTTRSSRASLDTTRTPSGSCTISLCEFLDPALFLHEKPPPRDLLVEHSDYRTVARQLLRALLACASMVPVGIQLNLAFCTLTGEPPQTLNGES